MFETLPFREGYRPIEDGIRPTLTLFGSILRNVQFLLYYMDCCCVDARMSAVLERILTCTNNIRQVNNPPGAFLSSDGL